MSILLRKNNWLVADWVMKLLFSDCKEVAANNIAYDAIISDIDQSVELYTFLLKYTELDDLEKIRSLQNIIQDVILFDKERILKPDWDKEAFKVYSDKLKELNELIIDELESSQV